MLRAGADAVIQAGTGSGKTLAYLLPLLARLSFSRETSPDDLQARATSCARDAELLIAGPASRHAWQTPSKPAHLALLSCLQAADRSTSHSWRLALCSLHEVASQGHNHSGMSIDRLCKAACAREDCDAQGPQLLVIVPTRELGVQTAMLVRAWLSFISHFATSSASILSHAM